jgi:hypothetical protein
VSVEPTAKTGSTRETKRKTSPAQLRPDLIGARQAMKTEVTQVR